MVFYAKSQGVYLASCATPFYVITVIILQNRVAFCFYSPRNLCLLNAIRQAERRGSLLMITACESEAK